MRANDFNLSAGRYRPMSQTAVKHRDPRELLDELAAIEAEIVEEVEALRMALAENNMMSWPTFRLDEVAEVAAGNPAPQEPADFIDDGYLFIRMQDLDEYITRLTSEHSTDRISAETVSKYRLRLFPAGKLIDS